MAVTVRGQSSPEAPAVLDQFLDIEALHKEIARRGEFVDTTDRLLYSTMLETTPGDAASTFLLRSASPTSVPAGDDAEHVG